MFRAISLGCSAFLCLVIMATLVSHVSAHTVQRPGRAMMGPMGMAIHIKQEAFMGYYDSHKDTYLSTDASSKAAATAMHVNYSAALAAVHGSPAMYLVHGAAAPEQIAVFGSQPGESDYSPLWTEVDVSWKAGVKPVMLTSDNQIVALAKKGKLTMHTTSTVLNCPIVKVGK